MAQKKRAKPAVQVSRRDRGGEEWRAMDDGALCYDRERGLDVLAKAKANIPRIRMRDVELRVVDRADRPVAGLPVEIVQTRSSFPVGDQLWGLDRMYRFGRADTDEGKYHKKVHASVFNSANALCYWTERPRNDGPKTEDIQGDTVTDGFAYCVDWANSEGMICKGHPLFWSIDKCVPEWVKRYPYEKRMMFAEVRVRNLVARFKGRVKIWDAVNEPLWEPAFKNLSHRHWPHIEPIGDIADYIEPVLRWAREEDPDALFLVNDYGLEQDKNDLRTKDGKLVTAAMQRRRFVELMAELRRRGVAPNALGSQAHVGGWISHDTQWKVYDDLSEAGLPIHVTEFWADARQLKEQGQLSDEQIAEIQAEYIANYLTCAFGHPSLEGFFFWGADLATWREYSSHELTSTYHRLHDLLHKQWKTRLEAQTDAVGVVRFRGFLGDYVLRHNLSPGPRLGVPFAVARGSGMPVTVTVVP